MVSIDYQCNCIYVDINDHNCTSNTYIRRAFDTVYAKTLKPNQLKFEA